MLQHSLDWIRTNLAAAVVLVLFAAAALLARYFRARARLAKRGAGHRRSGRGWLVSVIGWHRRSGSRRYARAKSQPRPRPIRANSAPAPEPLVPAAPPELPVPSTSPAPPPRPPAPAADRVVYLLLGPTRAPRPIEQRALARALEHQIRELGEDHPNVAALRSLLLRVTEEIERAQAAEAETPAPEPSPPPESQASARTDAPRPAAPVPAAVPPARAPVEYCMRSQGPAHERAPEPVILSVARPRRLAKGYAALFLVQLRPDPKAIARRIRAAFPSREVDESSAQSVLRERAWIEVDLSSADIEFSKGARKRVEHGGNEVTFWGKPRDGAKPGAHAVLLTLLDVESGEQLDALPFEVTVVDYAFDHVSRPLLHALGSIGVGLASCASFVLTSLGAVDSSFGLASGTAGLALVAFLAGSRQWLYRSREPAVPPH